MRYAIVLMAVILLPAATLAQDTPGRTFVGGRSSAGDQKVDLSDYIRPLDESDLEMKAYLEAIDTGGGCPTMPARPCLEGRKPYKDGGERLARYLIHHVEASEAEGFPPRAHYLNLIAMTETEAGFQFLRSRVRNRNQLTSLGEAKAYIYALSRTNDPRVLDEALTILDEEEPTSRLRVAAAAALFRVMEETGAQRADVLQRLRGLRSDERLSGYVTKKMDALGIE